VLDAQASRKQSGAMADTQEIPAPKAPDRKAKPMTFAEEVRDFVKFLAKLAVFVFILRSFIVAPFNIPSESMLPRLMVGDYLLVAKWPYGYSKYSMPYSWPLIPGRIWVREPTRGDVAVFKAPPGNDVDYIKRVIGLPGDKIQMRQGQLFINGTAVPKVRAGSFVAGPNPETGRCFSPEYDTPGTDGILRCTYPRFRETLPNGKSYFVADLADIPADSTEEFIVPKDHVFMMGDNRDNSLDSRFPAVEHEGIGIVPQKNLVGRALVVVFSTDGTASWIKPWTWVSAARGERIGKGF
jgi:signal peptidase I